MKNGQSATPDLTPFDEMVSLCIAAAEAVEQHGTPRLIELSRIFLSELGFELARRRASEQQID